MAVNGKLFSVAKGTVVSSEEVLIWKFNKGVIKSDQWEMKVYSNAECQCWEEEVSCERVKTRRVIVCHSGSEKLCRKQSHRLGKRSCSNFSLAQGHSYICCHQRKDKMVNEGWDSLTKNLVVWINRRCSLCYRGKGYTGLKTWVEYFDVRSIVSQRECWELWAWVRDGGDKSRSNDKNKLYGWSGGWNYHCCFSCVDLERVSTSPQEKS